MTIEKETKCKIGQPTKYPTDNINSLKVLFADKPNIKAAYLGWFTILTAVSRLTTFRT
ncbi:MAG: enhanced serine sensitivity protein SseB C-terminal domain-containing protein [Bacteroidetes bacterium]|nr:enhanced serine sensitivity protein SseB C-terminal domain-containing protein [Bacteroidota bacterium]